MQSVGIWNVHLHTANSHYLGSRPCWCYCLRMSIASFAIRHTVCTLHNILGGQSVCMVNNTMLSWVTGYLQCVSVLSTILLLPRTPGPGNLASQKSLAEFLNSPREFPGISKIQFYLGNDYTAERPYICKYYTAERPYNICILRGRSAV